MPVSTENSVSGPYTPNGTTTDFAFNFKATSADEVVALDQNGGTISTALYTVALDDDEGGTLTFTTAPALADYSEIYVASLPALTQPSDFDNAGPSFNPSALTRAFDRAAARDLYQQRAIDRALAVPFGELGITLPSASSRAGKFMAFDAGGALVPASGTGTDSDLRTDLASSASGAALVATTDGDTVQAALDILQTNVYYAEKYGVVADDSTDNTDAVIAALAAVQATGGTLIFPRGVIRMGDVGNWAAPNVTYRGAGQRTTVLKFTHSGVGLNADAFPIPAGQPGAGSQPFVDECNFVDLMLEGNSGTTDIFRGQGLARSRFRMEAREAGGAASKAFHFLGCMSNFMDLICSTNRDPGMSNIPRWGLYLTEGSRNGASVGHSSNNLMLRCMFEGLVIGGELYRADQTLFAGGAFQKCTNTGFIVRGPCRYNQMIGVAFENTSASAFDVQEQGIGSLYDTCYSVKEFRVQATRTTIRSGYFERLQIDVSSSHPTVEGIVYNNWATGSGGFSNACATLRWRSLYDIDAGAYHYPSLPRVGITVGASPFTWTNTTGLPVKVAIQTGTVSQVRGVRGGADFWLTDKTVPGELHVAPGDGIEVTYSATPGMSYIPLGGY